MAAEKKNKAESHPIDVLRDMDTEERVNLMISESQNFNMMYAVINQAMEYGGTFFDGIRQMNLEWGYAILERLRNDGVVYFNPVGGMISKPNQTAFMFKDKLVFPHWGENDIRIKKFEGGKHFYAYLDTFQVREGDKLKWNTREAALLAAKRLL